MNKKFSTFLVGALLASSMSVVGQTTIGDFADKLPIGNSGNLFQIAVATGDNTTLPTATAGVADSILTVGANGNLRLQKPADAAYGEGLWCVNIDTENQGKNPIFDFTNKLNSYLLQVAVEDSLLKASTDSVNVATGNLSGWKFSSVYENSLEQGMFLGTYFKADSILVLINTGDPGKVGVRAYAANSADLATDEDILRFSIFVPAGKYLTAEEYNTLFGTATSGYQSLQFTRDRHNTSLKNPFSDYKLFAEDATGNWLNFKRKTDDHYLRVDTSYANSVGVKFLNFAFGEEITPTNADDLPIPLQYNFQLEYFVHNDSIAIDVNQARYNLSDVPVWGSADPTTYGVTTNAEDSLHFKVQDLVTADEIRIVTIGTEPVNTKAYFGIGGCSANKIATSVADNLYTIKNTRGQYLVIPIYTDSVYNTANSSRDNIYPQWLTLDEYTDPNNIPAFQWIVEKTRKNDTDNTSPIRITNREFSITLPVTQLNTTDDGAELGYGYVKPAGFTAVPDAQKANPYLGYKFISQEESTVFTYVFNYLNTFAPEDASLYLGVNTTATDSLMYVGGKTNFQVIPMAKTATKYGAMPSYKTGTFKDVAQLVRHSYMLKIKDSNKLSKSNKVLVVDQEKRYAITDTSHLRNINGYDKWERPNGIDTAIFYLKTNNTKDDIDFYALLDTNTFTPHYSANYSADNNLWVVKAGVSEVNKFVRAQNQSEERTSTFSIDVDPDPLYRRFNTLDEGSVANDNPDTVKFFRLNNTADQLYEDAYSNYSKPVNPDAPVDQINFLGVQNKAQFPNANYAIYVDTAFVARPATKDSNIDTPKPQYMLVMGPQIVPPGTYCPVHGIGATCGHQVNTEGFTYGRYLINATDSAKNADLTTVRDSRYIWNTKWERLVFVNAVHKGDTLYLMNDGFDLKEGQLITNEALQQISYKWFDLGNNYHKDVVFSFRLIDDKDEKDFLIESETTNRDIANGLMIAPMEGGWVKVQNGVPVISRGAYGDDIVDAEKWNVLKTDEAPLANDDITVGDDVYNVIAGIGNVTIKNAAGSKVTISNILGQTVASATLTNDNQTIAVPAGIVVVAVEGEAAVKAIVK